MAADRGVAWKAERFRTDRWADVLSAVQVGWIVISREAEVYKLHRQGVPSPLIAEQMDLSYSAVRAYLTRAKQRLRGERKPSGWTPRKCNTYTRDEGWTDRQVSYLKTVDEDKANHYLNGIQICWGLAVRNEVERELCR